MGTKNKPGRFDCYAAAAPDEPIFILLGRDPHAADLVRRWAVLRQQTGKDADKVMEVLSCAADMYRYRMQRDAIPMPPLLDEADE